jgi:FkbM family methyltransferase
MAAGARFLLGSYYDYVVWARERFGTAFALRSLLGVVFRRGLVAIPAAGGLVFLRPRTSDKAVYEDIFLNFSYDVVEGAPELIVDAGGHIGLATAYLANKFPAARIVVIEPDEGNFAMLVKNTARFPNVSRVKGGLWGSNAKLRIQNPDASPWAFNLSEGGGVEGLTIPDVLRIAGKDRIDVLKIDIEGAEIEVLSTSSSWIDRVGTIMIELHDRFRAGCSQALDAATDGRGFVRSHSGEYTVLKRV